LTNWSLGDKQLSLTYIVKNIKIHDRSVSWLGTGTSMKNDAVKLVLLTLLVK